MNDKERIKHLEENMVLLCKCLMEVNKEDDVYDRKYRKEEIYEILEQYHYLKNINCIYYNGRWCHKYCKICDFTCMMKEVDKNE